MQVCSHFDLQRFSPMMFVILAPPYHSYRSERQLFILTNQSIDGLVPVENNTAIL